MNKFTKNKNRQDAFLEAIMKSGILQETSGIFSYDGYNNKVNHGDVIGTVVPQNSRWGITNCYKIIKVDSENGVRTLRIRKLTPKECFRLMGFDDESFHKAEAVNSNTQLYKQAGNSIVVDVLEELFCMMFDEDGNFFI